MRPVADFLELGQDASLGERSSHPPFGEYRSVELHFETGIGNRFELARNPHTIWPEYSRSLEPCSMKVTAKILALFFLIVVLLTLVTSYLTIWRTFARYESQQRQVVTWLSRWNREEIQRTYRENGITGVERLVEKLQTASPDMRIRWIRIQPNSMATGGFTIDGRPLVVASYRESPSILHTRYPIHIDDQCVGAIALESSLQAWEKENLQSALIALSTLGGLALFAVGTVYVGGIHWIGKPLRDLTDQARRMGEGDFSGRTPLKRQDEMGQLAVTLNRSCELLNEQRVLLEEETRHRIETLQQLRHAERLQTVGKIAAGVAHELGTPLSVISGRAAALQRSTLTPEQLQDHASAIKGEADRMSTIIRQLLDYSRQKEPQRRKLDLRDTIQQCVDLLRPIAEKRLTDLETKIPEEPAIAEFDAGQIQQVLTNLIVNGIQSSNSKNEVLICLRLEERNSNTTKQSGWRIEIQDTGEGIPPDQQEVIFEPFFTTKETGEGTGLGLPIAKGIIDDHGGQLTVESRKGEGTRFVIWIPQEITP